MKSLSEIKSLINYKINLKKTEIKYKVASYEHQLVIEYIIPYLNQYVRNAIISKGLNPDAPLKPKVVDNKKDFFPEPTGFLGKTTRGIIPNFSNYIPKWVKASFIDKNSHPIVKHRQPTEVKNVETTIPIGVTISEKIDNITPTNTAEVKVETNDNIVKDFNGSFRRIIS